MTQWWKGYHKTNNVVKDELGNMLYNGETQENR